MSIVAPSTSRRGAAFASAGIVAIAITASSASGQSMGPDFEGSYQIFDLGNIQGVPPSYGGISVDPNDPSRLLLGGRANNPDAAIYSVCLVRDGNGHIIGLDCDAPEYFASSPQIDGGLDFAPNGTILYTTYSSNTMGEILPGQSGPTTALDLDGYGIAPSTGTLRVVPAGFPGAGRLKICSYSANRWYDCTLFPVGDGLWDISVDPDSIQLTEFDAGGPEGIAYVPIGSAAFPVPSVLISMYSSSQIWSFEIDSNGDPIVETKRIFVTGLAGTEGAAIDPVTGDFLFSQFGSGFDHVFRVSGFAQPPCTADFDDSNTVDGDDLGTLLGDWNTTTGSQADLNGDGLVDGDDLGTLLGQWGPCSV
ncbi:MAG: hypothetical protein FJ253_06880 [Phycisphaerae bacterium]|nr:hypothetical protein [Phycisphaerae bacterium]